MKIRNSTFLLFNIRMNHCTESKRPPEVIKKLNGQLNLSINISSFIILTVSYEHVFIGRDIFLKVSTGATVLLDWS